MHLDDALLHRSRGHVVVVAVAMVAPVAFMSETTETVLIKGADGKPLRVNKSDYDADQASDKPSMTLHKDDDGPSLGSSGEPVKTFADLGMPPVAAPSAPDFTASAVS